MKFGKKKDDGDVKDKPYYKRIIALYNRMYDNEQFINLAFVKERYSDIEEATFQRFQESKLAMLVILTHIRFSLEPDARRPGQGGFVEIVLDDALRHFYLGRGYDKKEVKTLMSDKKTIFTRLFSSEQVKALSTDEQLPDSSSVIYDRFLTAYQSYFIQEFFAGDETAKGFIDEFCKSYLHSYMELVSEE